MKNVINGNKNMNRGHGVEEQNGETETTDTISLDQEVSNVDEAEETNNISVDDQEDYKVQNWVSVSYD